MDPTDQCGDLRKNRDGILEQPFLVEVYGHNLESSLVFYLIFPFYKMLFMNRLEFSGVSGATLVLLEM